MAREGFFEEVTSGYKEEESGQRGGKRGQRGTMLAKTQSGDRAWRLGEGKTEQSWLEHRVDHWFVLCLLL